MDALGTLQEQMLAYSAPGLSSGTAVLEHVFLDAWAHLQVLRRWLLVEGTVLFWISSCCVVNRGL